MKTSITALAALLLVPGLCLANPVYEYFLSEIQVAPDSEERIEVHMYTRERPFPIDLSGWQIRTPTCTAYVNNGIVLNDSSSYVVLSRENMTGPFALPDDSGEIELWESGGGPVDREFNSEVQHLGGEMKGAILSGHAQEAVSTPVAQGTWTDDGSTAGRSQCGGRSCPAQP